MDYLKRIAKNTGDEILDLEYRIRRKDGNWAWRYPAGQVPSGLTKTEVTGKS